MDIDDPRLAEAHKKMTERVEKYDERIVTVLKSHLATEEALNGLLAAASRRWKRRSFAGKIDVAKGLFVKEMTEELWATLEAGNDLRNAVAHGHKHGTIEARMTDLRKAYIAANPPQHKKGIEEMTELQLITTAFNHCGSHMVVAADRLEQERKKKK